MTKEITSNKNKSEQTYNSTFSDMRDIYRGAPKVLASLNKVIGSVLDEAVPLANKVAMYLIAAGGKRIRPLLTILTAQLCGCEKKSEAHIQLAACVEFIHTATLLHDDVVDGSQLRRGFPSANSAFGNAASVLVGDFLFSKAFEIMVATKSFPILSVLSSASAQIASGEVKQLSLIGNFNTTYEEYFDVIESKTATLFKAACEVGGLVANASSQEIQNLCKYGRNLGMAFQIGDDFLDYGLDGTSLGKNVGDDFKEGKVTFPILLVIEVSTKEEKEILKNALSSGPSESFFNFLKEMFLKYRISSKIREKVQSFVEVGLKALSPFKECPEKEALEKLINYCRFRLNEKKGFN